MFKIISLATTAMLVTAALPLAAGAAPPPLTSPQHLNGSIGATGCTYAIIASWTDPTPDAGNLSGTITCGARALVNVTGSWDQGVATLGIVSGTFDGISLTLVHLDVVVDDAYDPTVSLDAFTSAFADDALTQIQTAALSSPAQFGPISFLKGACSYTIHASWSGEPSSGGLDGFVTCGAKTHLDVTASWDSTVSAGQSVITLDTVGGKLADIDLTADTVTGTIDVPVSGTDDLDGLVSAFAQQLPSVVGQWIASQGLETLNAELTNPSRTAAEANTADDTLQQLDDGCAPQPTYDDASPDCHIRRVPLPDGTTANPPSDSQPGLDKMDDSQAGACPGLANDPPPDLFVVCVPTYLAGNFDAGGKTVVVVPGGAIVAAPIGSTLTAATTPSITTRGSILLLGGVIEGINLSMSAKDIELAGADITMLGNLSLTASDTLEVGQVDVSQVLGYIPPLLSTVVDNATGDVGTGINAIAGWAAGFVPGTLTLPAQLWSSKITLRAKTLKEGSGASISTDGLGLGGAAFYGPTVTDTGSYEGAVAGGAVTGATPSYANYGGSHLGLGAWPVGYPVWEDAMYGPGPRGSATDSPYKPSLPGGGGGGYYDGSEGTPGGGVIEMSATTMTLNGTVLADGDNGAPGPGGGEGAGGSINVTATTLKGSGSVHANGGGSAEDQGDLGGFGGGGAVAFHYATNQFTGIAHAHGGLQMATARTAVAPKDFGGAGTIFWQDTTAKPVAAGTPGQTTPVTDNSGGRLVLDGDASEAARPDSSDSDLWPTVDGTPLPDTWSNKTVELDLTDGAHAYAKDPTFGKIVIGSNAVLSTAPLVHKLVVTAGTLKVAKTGRLDMSGHGYAGGTDADGLLAEATSAPGAMPANRNNGGSHGGIGGINTSTTVGTPGSTYDTPADPHLPGGGGGGGYGDDDNVGTYGGGVLDIVAGLLTDNGVLSADGQDADAPTIAFPRPDLDAGAATGAGGALQVHAQTLVGNGSIEANGGGLNLLPSMGLGQPDAGGFTQADGANGGGGGGDVLVIAPVHKAFTGHVTAKGGINYLWAGSNGHGGHLTGSGGKKLSSFAGWVSNLG